ncbi:MAG TPA: cytidylate kinase-like family protein [Clostridia bacterium]|nr:cytidylate kinase-like family protein [Clostridia bacterium]
MSKRIVTIGRQFGSGGRQIGQLVANKLGVKCYDRTLIDLTAKASGFDAKTLEKYDEKSNSKLLVPIPIGHYANFTSVNFEYTLNDKIFFIQSDIIKKIAEKESAVIVGRCANYVLSQRSDVLRVYIYADIDARVKAVAERHYIDEKSATQLITKTDRKRASYYKFYTGSAWGSPTDYDLMIDSALGYDKIADIIVAATK